VAYVGDNLCVMESTFHESRVRRSAWIIAITFFFLGALLLSNHEMWRDEIQAWLLARDSNSVPNLFANLKYEGHPGLWYLLLMPLTRVSDSPTAMQVLHLIVATSTIYVFARYSPFTTVQKLLFSFGYFPFYEYSIISRNYGLGVLLIFVFCSLFERRYTNFLMVSLVLFLLSHTSVFALIIAVVLFFGLLIDFFCLKRSYKALERPNHYEIYAGFFIITLGIITAVLQLIPPADSGYDVGWFLEFDIEAFKAGLKTLTAAYLPIPNFDLHFWNTCAWTANSYLKYLALLSVCSFVACSMTGFVRKPFVCFLFVGCTFGLLVFFHIKINAGMRHTGFLFITFIMSAWLYRCYAQANWAVFSEPFVQKWEMLFSYGLTLILVLHVGASLVAASIDYRRPFSMAKSVAEYINQRGLNKSLIVGYPDFTTTAVVGYLGISKVYYPQGDRFGSYVRWDQNRNLQIPEKDVVDKALELKARQLIDGKNEGVLLIVSEPLGNDLAQAGKLQEIGQFTGAICGRDPLCGGEDFYIYSLE
jgi:hypothetical protein